LRVEQFARRLSKGSDVDAAAYLRGVLRSWWLVLLVLVAGGAGGFAVYERATPEYSAQVTMIVANKTAGMDEQSARSLSELRATTMAQVAPTNPAIAAAVEAATQTDNASGLSVEAGSSDSFVTVTVKGLEPAVVRDVAAAYPDIIADQVDSLAGSTGSQFKLTTITPPTLPTEPFAPSLKRDVGGGLLAGLILGLALAILRETLNRTVRDTEELRRLTGLPLLGIVPEDLPRQLVPAASHPRSARAEAYRQVRTTVMSASDRRPLVLAVTSATLGEGKTSVSTNLAVVLSRAGHRVALIDADLRRPRVAKFMDIPAGPGLTDVLIGNVRLEDALVLRDDGRFAILPAGTVPTNPSEALGSSTMKEILGRLSEEFEFVIVDTPPVIPVTDALVLAPWVDGLILVARLGETTPDRLERAQAATEGVHAKVFGIVANNAGKGSDSDYSYTYRSKRKADAPVTDAPVDSGASEQQSPPSGGRHAQRPTVPVVDSHGSTTSGSNSSGRD
jgi:polysaccharide biosynthesis transport protein